MSDPGACSVYLTMRIPLIPGVVGSHFPQLGVALPAVLSWSERSLAVPRLGSAVELP